MSDIETIVWCAHCQEDKYRIVRKPTGAEGVVTHETTMIGPGLKNRKVCDCGRNLSRKE